jgi:hypothetical protein
MVAYYLLLLQWLFIIIINTSGCWWLRPVFLATQEAEIRSIRVQSQPRQIFQENLSQKTPTQSGAGRVAQMVECLHSTLNALI